MKTEQRVSDQTELSRYPTRAVGDFYLRNGYDMGSEDMLEKFEEYVKRWSVPTDVCVTVRKAFAIVAAQGVKLTDGRTDDYASLAASGKPIAVFVGKTRLSVALDPEVAEQALHAHQRMLTLEKDSGVTWFLQCSYDSLTAAEDLQTMEALLIQALERSARNVRDAGSSSREERRRATVQAGVERCPVPGCNLLMIGGSCGFHD